MEQKKPRLVHRIRTWPRTVLITVGVVVVLLVAARVALPYAVKRMVNERLRDIPGYAGHVGDIDISLWRGAYTLHRLQIYRLSGEVREPFVFARLIDFSVAWRELFRGQVVSDILVDQGEVTFVAGATEEESQKDVDRRWQDVIHDLFPLEITHLELTNGMVRYQDTKADPDIDLFVKNANIIATGLRNRREDGAGEFPATISIRGDSLGGGKLAVEIAAEPLAPQPHFHLSAKIDDVNLPDLNDSLRAYANVDVGRGTFRMAAEMAGNDGGFQGYVKPFFENLEFNNVEDKKKGVFDRIWENVVQGLAWLVKNKQRDQIGTRIPFQGRFGDPKVGLFATITNLFRHGFIRAFNPTVEGTINPKNILPSGKSADGKEVADTKADPGPAERKTLPAGSPTGRTTERVEK